MQANALDFLSEAAAGPYDLVFLDPPFAADLLEETCRLLKRRHLLAEDALVYLELPRKAVKPHLPAGWQIEKDKTAGNVRYMLVSVND